MIKPKDLVGPKRLRSSVFAFKRFQIDQTGCAMKVSSDATLLGALADAEGVDRILDIGTGTGLLALMLAQKTPPSCHIDAVELDPIACQRAHQNKNQSPFADRITVIQQNIVDFQLGSPGNYDLIICNPPFYEKSLLSTGQKRNLAWHSNGQSLTFDRLLDFVPKLLSAHGSFWILIPADLRPRIQLLASKKGLFLTKQVFIRHTIDRNPNRVILCFRKNEAPTETTELVRYDHTGVVSQEVQSILRDYMIYFPRLNPKP